MRAGWIYVACFAAALVVAGLMDDNLNDLNQIAGALGASLAMWLMGGAIAFLNHTRGGQDMKRLLLIWVIASAIWYFLMYVGGGVI